MCDHYDSYYRETPEEARDSKLAAEKEAARKAAYERKRENKLVSDYAKRFGLTHERALREVRRMKFVMEWRG